jgi:hypothetical protein
MQALIALGSWQETVGQHGGQVVALGLDLRLSPADDYSNENKSEAEIDG